MKAIMMLGVALLSASAWTEPAAPASPLVGAWRLVQYEDHPESGPSLFPFGRNPQGLLIYSVTGDMSIQVMKQPHPKVASGDEEKVTPGEKQALFDSFMAYFGTWTSDPARGVVVHHVEGDLWGVFDGRDEERPFQLSGDRLTLEPQWESDGRHWVGIRVFERVGGSRGSKPLTPDAHT